MQNDEETDYIKPAHFASRVMTIGEKKYNPLKQAFCALMFATVCFHPYLLPRKFTIISVDDTFSYTLHHASTSVRISKWVFKLQEFEFTVTTENTTREIRADILTHRVFEEKIRVPKPHASEEKVTHLEDAYTLHFDGAFKRILGKAVAGIVITHPLGNRIYHEGIHSPEAKSNNEAEYAALIKGLEVCLELGITRLCVYGDAMLIIKQIRGTWACKNFGLKVQLQKVRQLMKRFKAIELHHLARIGNQDADALVGKKLLEVEVHAVSMPKPKFNGSQHL